MAKLGMPTVVVKFIEAGMKPFNVPKGELLH